MQTQPNFQQLLDSFVADLEADQAKIKAGSNDPDWDLYYANTEAEAKAARAYFDSRVAVQRAIL